MVWLGPRLTALSEKILDLGDGGVGLHLREAQSTGKSAPWQGAPTPDAGFPLVMGDEQGPG